jgi:hypothetical protein
MLVILETLGHVDWIGKMPAMNNSYALVIGIADYQHINSLPGTVTKDANDIYDLLVDPHYCGYSKSNVKLLVNENATQAKIREGLANLAERCDDDSTVLFYISSHGGLIESGPYAGAYLLPVDTEYSSIQSLANSAISGTEFSEALRQITARKVVVFFDCCHSGGIGQPKDIEAPSVKAKLPESYYALLQQGRGRVIIASSRSTEFSYVLPNAKNSLFTQHLLTGIKGGTPGPGGVIRIFDLFNYLQPRVVSDHPAQHPIFKAEVEDNFPISLYLGGKSPEPAPTLTASDEFAFDVFVSYRQQEPDMTWVRETLVPALTASSLKVFVDYEDFRLGRPVITEMERGVEKSRYTLSVLSPAYLESNFATLEAILADHLGMENSQRRLLAIMREPCRPRLGMRARLWLDMTKDKDFETNLKRLVYELKQPPTL